MYYAAPAGIRQMQVLSTYIRFISADYRSSSTGAGRRKCGRGSSCRREGLTEGLYYELKPLNISLHLVEQGGTSGNNFQQNVRWSLNPDIQAYDTLSARLRELFASAAEGPLDDPMTVVQVISDLAEGRSTKFRTVVGDMGNQLMTMRESMPVEEYLETMAVMFG